MVPEWTQAKPQTKFVEELTLRTMTAVIQLTKRTRFRQKLPINPNRLFVCDNLSIKRIAKNETIVRLRSR